MPADGVLSAGVKSGPSLDGFISFTSDRRGGQHQLFSRLSGATEVGVQDRIAWKAENISAKGCCYDNYKIPKNPESFHWTLQKVVGFHPWRTNDFLLSRIMRYWHWIPYRMTILFRRYGTAWCGLSALDLNNFTTREPQGSLEVHMVGTAQKAASFYYGDSQNHSPQEILSSHTTTLRLDCRAFKPCPCTPQTRRYQPVYLW